MKKYYKQVH